MSGEPDIDGVAERGAQKAAPPTAVQFRPAAEGAQARAEESGPPPGTAPPAPLPLHPATVQYVPYRAAQPFAPWPAATAVARRPASWGSRRARIEELEAENAHLRAWVSHLGGAEPLHLVLETDRLRRELAALHHAVHTARAELTATHAAVTQNTAALSAARTPPVQSAADGSRTPSPFRRIALPSRRKSSPDTA
ncbi:hypothetical protein EDD29_6216 [Actinocorallia herbida]|uniref:Uncharacterized protein n=1 Tax=Actinocorallia herbida TaxID=58109 RepID=A0A3N1D4T0_9ACTN|nr:hypothetical protein EDD29_6216 [Actinocorallia herbida]